MCTRYYSTFIEDEKIVSDDSFSVIHTREWFTEERLLENAVLIQDSNLKQLNNYTYIYNIVFY